MTDGLRRQLQTAPGSAHTLEHELGGGGMRRIFVARDEALGRPVVVKVLAPYLAEGPSAERFGREVARSSRPACTTDGLPYYTMPPCPRRSRCCATWRPRSSTRTAACTVT